MVIWVLSTVEFRNFSVTVVCRFSFSSCRHLGLVLNMLRLLFCVVNGIPLSVCLIFTGKLANCFVMSLGNVSLQ